MLTAIGILLSLGLAAWLIWLAVKRKPVRAHMVMYALAWLTAIFAIGFFLNMDIDRMVKILVSIVVGALLIALAANIQRRQLKPPAE